MGHSVIVTKKLLVIRYGLEVDYLGECLCKIMGIWKLKFGKNRCECFSGTQVRFIYIIG